MMKSIRNILLVLLLLATGFFVFQKINLLPSFQNLLAPQPVQIDQSPIIIRQIKDIAQLMTIETYSEVVVDSAKFPKNKFTPQVLINPVYPFQLINIPRIVLVVRGRVVAGLDLKRLNPQSVRIRQDSIIIRLPKAEILEVITNPTGLETFSEVGEWTPDEVNKVKEKARAKIIGEAMEQNVLQKAEEKAKTIVEKLLISAGYKNVVVQME